MNYTDEEICTIYKNAESNLNKIKLLEELTLLPKEKIIEILNKNGYKIKQPKNTRKKYNDEDFLALYNEGLNDAEISRKIGCSEGTVNNWRKENGLLSNYIKRTKKACGNRQIKNKLN